jgi:hypothetical protein
MGKRHHGTNGVQNFRNHPVGRVGIITRDLVLNFIKSSRLRKAYGATRRMQSILGHEPNFERAAALLFKKVGFDLVAGDTLTLPLFSSS